MADQILFDRLRFIDRLKRAGIDDNQARAHAEAMDEALHESVATKLNIAMAVCDMTTAWVLSPSRCSPRSRRLNFWDVRKIGLHAGACAAHPGFNSRDDRHRSWPP
jgi:hypothetical protein